jgi:hypothetical protein
MEDMLLQVEVFKQLLFLYQDGLPGATAATELYDGTSWTNDTNVNSPRFSTNMGAVGTTSASLYAGGETPGSPGVNTVEEYTGAGVPLVQTITAS